MDTVPSPSRPRPDPRINLPSINTFGDFSDFLRSAVADEESRELSEGMRHLASQAETVVAALRRDRHRDNVGPLLMDMLTVLREHRGLVVGLGLAWRGLYEYASYLQSLNNFRVLIGQWLLHAQPWDNLLDVTAAEFELIAWRTLGEGMLLIDMYEQWLQREEQGAPSLLGDLQEPQLERVRQWWQKLRR